MQNMGRLSFESFSEAIKLDPQNACALTHCGILYKDEGRLVEAAESFEKALNADSAYKPAAECLAVEGIQKYYDAIKINEHYAPAYYNLGVVYSEILKYDTALNCYKKAALGRPTYAELESAVACYERCLAISPNFEIAKNKMAIASKDLGTKVKLEGDINQGVAYYKKALYHNWHYADAMYNLGVAYGEMLKFDMAIVFYELSFHFNPHCAELALSIKLNFSQLLNNLGVVFTVQGKMDAAACMIEKAIVANPTYAEAYNNLGVLYRDAGDITLSIESYEQCLKIDADSRNAGFSLPEFFIYAISCIANIYEGIISPAVVKKNVASMVREDKADILVELTGHTANNKLGMMASKPAPVQHSRDPKYKKHQQYQKNILYFIKNCIINIHPVIYAGVWIWWQQFLHTLNSLRDRILVVLQSSQEDQKIRCKETKIKCIVVLLPYTHKKYTCIIKMWVYTAKRCLINIGNYLMIHVIQAGSKTSASNHKLKIYGKCWSHRIEYKNIHIMSMCQLLIEMGPLYMH
ncbi:hypothetical protein DCAR_0522003 [Daucus carota subsp. sativus]|uniref:UDP-N-acetylglucosamine--peptide N-acetylglucosaminyltransferase SPINDLY n=1 Tax=Daucus carota subsp. sativus TaxID=79200 RepID=A0AAF1B130_DAUCS|nr:hypothetical protein DCAR_0522003 [Daucus carota subsp. sativus]